VGQPQAQDLSSELEDVITAARAHLTNKEFRELEELTEYQDIFAGNIEDYGGTNKVYRRISTGDAPPIRQPPRRIPLAKEMEVKDMLNNMQRHGGHRRIRQSLVTPVILVRKKNGELRFCVDHRKLNDDTKKDCFLLLRIDIIWTQWLAPNGPH
jgi:hypothetical protein